MAGALSHFSTKPSLLSLSRCNPNRPSSSYRPLIVTMAHNPSYWASIDADIEAHLKKAIPIRPPLSVFEPMHHLAFAAPRTTAPALCIGACELVGGHRDQAMAAASALHLLHAAAYTHEHLPLTDRARPKPTVHHAFNPNIELLTGDGIFAFGYELLASYGSPAHNNSDRILRVIIEITRAMGSQGVVDGQYCQVQRRQSDGEEPCHAGWIDYVCKKKEGALHACGAACGAILGGGSEGEIEKLRKYGLYVGMIQGMLHGVGKNEKGSKEVVEKLRELALKELENFNDKKVESMSSLFGEIIRWSRTTWSRPITDSHTTKCVSFI